MLENVTALQLISKFFSLCSPMCGCLSPYGRPYRIFLWHQRWSNKLKGHTFDWFYLDWIKDRLTNRFISAEEKEILNQVLAMQQHTNIDLYPSVFAACLSRDLKLIQFSTILRTVLRISIWNIDNGSTFHRFHTRGT